ncbi:MAG: hypothetical protein AB7N65_30590 [Vicinamibacterales bacterium]
MRRTHKLRQLDLTHVAAVIGSSPSVVAAARALDVDPATIFRWRKAGKIPRPVGRATRRQVQEASCSHLQDRATSNLWAANGSEAVPGGPTDADRPVASVTGDSAGNIGGAAGIPPAADADASVGHPGAWATAIRARFDLDETEDALVDLAARALRTASDPAVPAAVQLVAAGRFAQLVKQLDFPAENDATEAETRGARQWPRAIAGA